MSLLRRIFPHKEIGWKEINEKFTRYTLLKTRWFNVYLHELDAQEWHPQCHDHPWSFLTLLLWNGYFEQVGDKFYRRRAGSILYRPANFSHNVTTPYGKSWSIVITSRKTRDWGFVDCRHEL
jgi:hypothetical protein